MTPHPCSRCGADASAKVAAFRAFCASGRLRIGGGGDPIEAGERFIRERGIRCATCEREETERAAAAGSWLARATLAMRACGPGEEAVILPGDRVGVRTRGTERSRG